MNALAGNIVFYNVFENDNHFYTLKLKETQEN